MPGLEAKTRRKLCFWSVQLDWGIREPRGVSMIEQEKYVQVEQQRTFQQEQTRRMIEIFGGFIQGMRR